MARIKTTVYLPNEILKELKEEADLRGIKLFEIVNEACTFYLQHKNSEQKDKVYAPIIADEIHKNFKSLENRLAGIMAKNALDSASTMFMVIKEIAKSTQIEPNKIYEDNRKMAVKHVKKREDFVKFLTENDKTE